MLLAPIWCISTLHLRPDPRHLRPRAEAEAAEAARAAQAAELERRRAAKAQALPEEPPAGAPCTALVRVRLPNGQNFQRRRVLVLQAGFRLIQSFRNCGDPLR